MLGRTINEQPAQTQEKVSEVVQFPGADPTTVNNLWYIIIIGLFVLAALSAVFGFILLNGDKDASAAWALASTAGGGIIALVAPVRHRARVTPARRRRDLSGDVRFPRALHGRGHHVAASIQTCRRGLPFALSPAAPAR